MTVASFMSRELPVWRASQTLDSLPAGESELFAVTAHCALVGVVTDGALARAFARDAGSSLRLADIMTDDVAVAYPDTPVAEAEALMRARRLRRLPVVNGTHRPLGLLALDDLSHPTRSSESERDAAVELGYLDSAARPLDSP
jgi:signal-transduction protein with cAMP-binding, CBS, and nucleotidyltransferase domain